MNKKLAEEALKEGISMNQYCIYLLGQNHHINILNENKEKYRT